MAKKTPRKKRKPNTLDAISGTDAIEVLRILSSRDKELSKEIDVIVKEILADVSIDEVATGLQAELESLAVEEVWVAKKKPPQQNRWANFDDSRDETVGFSEAWGGQKE